MNALDALTSVPAYVEIRVQMYVLARVVPIVQDLHLVHIALDVDRDAV